MQNKRKQGDGGFTLVELLITVTILAIIITPLLHAFVSSARTNAKAHATMKATTIAENIMEEFEDISVEELTAKYGVTQNPANGQYEFNFTPTDLSEFGAQNYTAKVLLDPNANVEYTKYNAENVVDVNTISSANNAIYAMGETYDESVYTIFASKSESASLVDASCQRRNAAWFRTALQRTITAEIKKGANITDASGNVFPTVKVVLDIKYRYNSNFSERVLLDTDLEYSVRKDLFDNTSTKEPFKGLYLIYSPRFEACVGAFGKTDDIVVKNEGNVEANLYVIRLQRGDDGAYLGNYLTGKRAKIKVVERPAPPITSSIKSALKLRTNLHLPENSAGKVQLGADIKYFNNVAEITVASAEQILQTKRADGKSIDGKSDKERIYKMQVSVLKSGETTPLVTLDGTKID